MTLHLPGRTEVTGRLRRALAAAASLAALAGCGTSPTERYYRLDAPATFAPGPLEPAVQQAPAPGATGAGAQSHPAQIRLSLTSIPPTIDRPQIVRLLGPNEMQVLEFDRWAEPVPAAVARTLEEHLVRQFPGAWIVPQAAVADGSATAISVTIDSMEFDGAQARLRARWLVTSPTGSQRAGALALERASRGTAAGAVAAWSVELGEVAQSIARTVRELPANP